MPQLRKFDWSPEQSRDKATVTIERALERINYYAHYKPELARLDWYVSLAKKDLDCLSDGDLLILQEEFIAMAFEAGNYMKIPEKPNRQQIEEIQQTIGDHLNQLADIGKTTIGPFSVKQIFIFKKTPQDQIAKGALPHTVIRGEIGEPTTNVYLRTFLNHLCELLEENASSIWRCPHCSQIYLRERRHKRYCSRECQRVAVMRQIRKKEKGKRVPIKARAKRGHTATEKGDSSHGKKRR